MASRAREMVRHSRNTEITEKLLSIAADYDRLIAELESQEQSKGKQRYAAADPSKSG